MLQLLARWFSKAPQPTIEVIRRDPCRLRLAEWRSQPGLVARSTNLMSNIDLRVMLDVLQTEHPANVVLADSTPLDQRAVWQARCEGYTMALANLDSMAVYAKPHQPLEATFEPPELADPQNI